MSTLFKPGLYVVATPIGNLGDITDRARSVLLSAQFILCEDTRQTKKLLQAYSLLINQKLLCVNEHTETFFKEFILREISTGTILALVSDAGTPGVCDPGAQLVAFAHQHQLPVIPIPGPSSLTTFLSAIGTQPQPIHFIGFLPKKNQAIIDKITQPRPESHLLIFLESPQRIKKTVELLKILLPSETPCYVGRELTKMYEQLWIGPLNSLTEMIGSTIPEKGEFIMGISLEKSVYERWHSAARSLLPILGINQTAHWMNEHFDINKNQVYKFLTSVANTPTMGSEVE